MIIATAATLFVNKIVLVSGEQAAMAIRPFAGQLAGTLFAFGILNAGFMGIVVVSLSTSYAFAEFFGIPGSLNTSFSEGKPFYIIFLGQLLVAAGVVMFPSISLFQLVIATQALNAMMLPLVFYYLINLTSNKLLMRKYVNNVFQKYFSIIATIFITVASFATLAAAFLGL
jgi:Mn2+/Fe2+ NRAMP family transporter